MPLVFQENFDLKPRTYFKIGGPARYFTEVRNEEELQEAVRFSKEKKVPFFILGVGSNILVSDAGYRGLVIQFALKDIEKLKNGFRVGGGVANAILVAQMVRAGMLGFEWAIGIPGSVGGSVRGNAGCFSGEMRDVVESVTVFNAEVMKFEDYDNASCEFSYRHSVFKSRPELIIARVSLRLRQGSPELAQRLVRYYTSIRGSTQDIGVPSAGCVFKNVFWPKEKMRVKRLLFLLPHLADFKLRPTIPSSFLIDQAGLKGKKVGGISVSRKHANYIINDGTGKAEEVIILIGIIKEEIHRRFDLQLDEEIQYVGF